MSYNTIKRTSGRQECIIFEIDLDINDPAFDAEFVLDPQSYGTPKTTNDLRAYKEGEVRTYRYSNQYIANLDCFPNLRSAKSNPPKANPGIDIGFRATADAQIEDFETSDAFELQGVYASRRVTGSHFAKLFARNFIKNRPARIRRGYLVDSVYAENNFQTEHYIIDEYQGPSLDGKINFKMVDVLALTNGINAKAPETSNATLNAILPASGTSIAVNLESGLSAADIEGKFGANGAEGLLAIGEEYMAYTVTSATGIAPVVMTVTRARFGTTVREHAVNATVQKCIAYQDQNIIEIIEDLIRNYTDIDPSYIPSAEWAAIGAGELNLFTLTNIIAKETEVKKMLNELIQIAGLTIYVDVVERKIVITATPNFDNPVIVLDSVEHIEVSTLKIENDFQRLVTRQLVQWAPRDYSKTDASNYDKSFRVAAIREELPDRLGTKSEGKEVISRWIPNTTNGNQIATGIAQRNVSRFSQIPTRVSLELDSKYVGDLENGRRLWVGSVFQIITPAKVFCNGAFQSEILTCQCTSVSAGRKADKWKVEGISYKANVPPNADYFIPAGQYIDFVLADEYSFTEAREYIVVISSGAVFGSSTTSIKSFRQGTFPVGATLRMINQGQIIGAGGQGGNGGDAESTGGTCVGNSGGDGLRGGDALELTTNTVIDNSFGLIGGGGGGGGGASGFCSGNFASGGNGGGGGQGFTPGLGGFGGVGINFNGESDGANGQAGTVNGPGIFQTRGGFLGQRGDNGEGSNGGLPGAAIITNGNTVTITAGNNAEQIRGAII